jgi:hypothetical protein
LAGQTNAALVISNIQVAAYDNHYLVVTVTNLYGQATSADIYLQIMTGPPTSVAITPSSFATYAGYSVPFTVTAQGTQPFVYRWYSNSVAVAAVTGAVYTNTASADAMSVIATARRRS